MDQLVDRSLGTGLVGAGVEVRFAGVGPRAAVDVRGGVGLAGGNEAACSTAGADRPVVVGVFGAGEFQVDARGADRAGAARGVVGAVVVPDVVAEVDQREGQRCACA